MRNAVLTFTTWTLIGAVSLLMPADLHAQETAFPPLTAEISKLGSGSTEDMARTAEGLADLGEKAAAARPALRKAFQEHALRHFQTAGPEHDLAVALLHAIVEIGAEPDDIELLLGALIHGSGNMYDIAHDGLTSIGKPSVGPLLTLIFTDGLPYYANHRAERTLIELGDDAVPPLLELAGSEDFSVQYDAIRILHYFRDNPTVIRIAEWHVRQIRHVDPTIRFASLNWLDDLNLTDPYRAALIQAFSAEENPECVGLYFWIFNQMGSSASAAAPRIIHHIEHGPAALKVEALVVLDTVAPARVSDCAPALIETFFDENRSFDDRHALIQILVRHKLIDDSARARFWIDLITRGDNTRIYWACWELGSMNRLSLKPFIPALVDAMNAQAEGSDNWRHIVNLLNRVDPSQVKQQVAKMDELRFDAMHAEFELQNPAPTPVAVKVRRLVESLIGGPTEIHDDLVAQLVELRPDVDPDTWKLAATLREPENANARAAWKELYRIPDSQKPIIDRLVDYLVDSDPEIRLAAAEALTPFKAEAMRAQDLLEVLRWDASPDVRAAAKAALEQLKR